MIEVIKFCEENLKKEIENQGAPPAEIKDLLEKGFDKKVEDLEKVQHLNNFYYFRYLATLIVFRVCENAPSGVESFKKCCRYFDWLVEAKIDCKPSLVKIIEEMLVKEVSHCKSLDDLSMWLSLSKEFTDKNEGTMEGILRSSYFSVVEHVWAGIHLTTSLLQVEETCKYLKNLSTIQHFDLVNEDMQSIIFKNLERTLYFEFDIDGLRALQGEQLKPDFSQGKSIVDCLSQLNLSKEDQESLKKISLHFQLEEDLYQEPPKSCPNIHKLADLSQISFGDLFYAQETSQFYVRVYRGSHPQVGQIAIKEYIAKNLEIDLQKFQSEIDILEKLSSLSSVETCFLKFYGNWLNGKNLYLVMEYHPYTLMSIISVYKQQNYNISEKDLSIIIKKLLHSFAIMESMGIYHKDIKPHNILVSNDFEFKIIDFSISEIKEQIDTTLPTDFNVIQGTSGYVAPELQKLLEKGERNGTYNVAKADVFSLGLTILQIICMEDFGMLNHEEYNERLMKKVEQVKINWIRLILEKMLHVDYSQRKSFKYLVSMVPQDKTQIT